MIIKPIYITYQEGLEALAPHIASAVGEVMSCFPQEKGYDKLFPVQNLGNWKSDNYVGYDNGEPFLQPYESIDWYIARAKLKAVRQHRWAERGQISIDQLYEDLSNDPHAERIPQLSLLITRYDLYGTQSNGQLLNFCNGVTKEGKFAIISTARFMNGNTLDLERFKTVVMHEFGHLIGLTPDNRENSYEQLGTHCANGDIMEQDMSGTGRAMTQDRLRRKQMGLKPICNDCIKAGCNFFDREIAGYYARQQLRNLMNQSRL